MPKISKFTTTVGTDGDDYFVGTAARDIVYGGDGRDEIYGGHGADRLFGNAGDDTLSGGWGTDRLTGGAGADTFCFDGDFGDDRVMDFDAAEGDSLMFVLYDPSQAHWTGDDLLALCVQDGSSVVIALPGSDERATLYDTDLSDLSASTFQVVYHEDPGLVA